MIKRHDIRPRRKKAANDYVMACARVAAVANPAARFCFVSGQGASATSSQAWARIKAETEKDLEATFGSRLTVFRPGYIHPADGRATPRATPIMRALRTLRPDEAYHRQRRSAARAVLHCATGGAVSSPADNRAIIAAAAAYLRSRVSAGPHRPLFFQAATNSAGVSTRIPCRSAARKWRRLSVTITAALAARATSAMCAS